MKRIAWLMAGIALGAVAPVGAHWQAATPRPELLLPADVSARRPATPPSPADLPVDDAHRAAAARLIAASRFRDRQAVVLDQSLHAAQADLTADCVSRAAEGRSLADCRATAEPGSPAAARLAARRSDMLDEIIAASQTIYARHFSADEMDGITRFFRTPVGRKYAAVYPQIVSEVQARRNAVARRYLTDSLRDPSR